MVDGRGVVVRKPGVGVGWGGGGFLHGGGAAHVSCALSYTWRHQATHDGRKRGGTGEGRKWISFWIKGSDGATSSLDFLGGGPHFRASCFYPISFRSADFEKNHPKKEPRAEHRVRFRVRSRLSCRSDRIDFFFSLNLLLFLFLKNP